MDTLSFIERIGITDPTAITVISVSLMLFFGFFMTRITKFMRLPNVTAYILSGILMGPFVFNLIPKSTIEGMSFIGDIALSFIAFGTGEYFKMDILKKSLYQHSGPEKRLLKSKMSKNRIETYLCDGKARK